MGGAGGRRGRAVAFVTLVTVVSSCREQVFEPVRDGLVSTAAMSGRVKVTTKADLLFVLDDSPSMENEQEKLAAAFPELVSRLEALDPPVDYRVAVMTTSVEERFGPCDAASTGAGEQCSADFGGGPFTCEAGACRRGFEAAAGRLVAAPGNDAVLESSTLDAATLTARFSENVRVGLGGARQEQPLRALKLAFGNGALDGFWRPDARLVVLVASDEDDCSDSTGTLLALERAGPDLVDRCEESARSDDGRLDVLSEWTNGFRALPDGRGGVREVSMGAIVSLASGSTQPGLCRDPACVSKCEGPGGLARCEVQCDGSLRVERCREECVAHCASFCGAQTPSRRLARVVRELGGPLASVCETDYAPALARLAAVMGIPERFELPSRPADARALFFEISRGEQVIQCREGADYTLELAAAPVVLTILPGGACRLLPDDRWRVTYLAR
jgi:hypothetical protein